MIFTYITLIILNFIFVLFFDFFEKKINLYDYPNHKKIHLKKTSLAGGIIFFFNLSFFLIFYNFLYPAKFENLFGFDENFSLIIFFVSLSIIFFIGIFDDKKNLSVRLRMFSLIIILIINLLINESLNISNIRLSFFDSFSIGSYSIFWTLLCFLLFINAFNFFDGINLQSSGLIFAIITFFLIHQLFIELIIVIFISNVFFAYLNYKSKIFLGNSGSFFLPFLFGSLLISAYNSNLNINSDEIVILLLIPGLDLFRLFFMRIYRKKNPFKGDREHIHHYLLDNFSQINSVLIVQFLIWIPFIIYNFFGNFFISSFLQVIFYTYIIYKYKT